MSLLKRVAQIVCIVSSTVVAAHAGEEPPRPEYGADITVEVAKKIAAATLAECSKNKWNVAVAVVNTHGSLVYYERMNNTQSASARIAVDKASAAAIMPSVASHFPTASERITFANSSFMRVTMCFGMPFGPQMPYQCVTA